MTFINKIKGFKMKFRYNLVISNDFIIKINSKVLLITIKRIISLIIDMNKDKEIIILSLSVLNDYFIINFKSNTFKTIIIFNEILFEIKMKLNKLLIFFLIIICFF